MAARIRVHDFEAAAAFELGDCISCGCCAYVCSSHIPLVQYFSHAKGELWAAERSKLRGEATRKLAEAKAVRLEREAEEKRQAAARRKAEREAAAQAAAAAAASASENVQGEQA